MSRNRKFFYRTICILLVIVLNSMPFVDVNAAAETNTLYVTSNFDRDIFGSYKAKTGVKIEKTINYEMEEAIATAYAVQDDRMDIYMFTAYAGLYLVKEKNFYVPLDDSEILQQEYQKMYPGIQKAVSDEGHVIGWILDVQPQLQMDTGILSEMGLPMPQTFDEFLDTCQLLIEMDLMDGGKYKLSSFYDYTQADLLDFYMKQYISANYVMNQIPDFTDETFLKTVERLKTTLPEKQTFAFSKDELNPIFMTSVVFPYPADGMLPLPQVIEGQNNAVETYATIAVINPYSKNKEEAIRFLEYCAQNPEDEYNRYFYDSTMTEPIVNVTMLDTYNKLQAEMDGYLQLETLTQEQKDRVAQLEMMIPEYKAKSYKISPEAIERYAELAQNLLVNEGSPVSYDQQLRQYASQYLSGLMTLEQFSQKCQSHIERIFKELQ